MGQLFSLFPLSQLLHVCLQGSQLLFQSLWDKNCFRQELKILQYNVKNVRSRICSLLKCASPVFIWCRKAHTSTVFSLAVLLSRAACRLSSIDLSCTSFSWILQYSETRVHYSETSLPLFTVIMITSTTGASGNLIKWITIRGVCLESVPECQEELVLICLQPNK